MAKTIVNAAGQPCPIPVVKATQALKDMQDGGTLEVLVDNDIAVQNLKRLAEEKGLSAAVEQRGGGVWAVVMTVPAGGCRAAGEDAKSFVVVVHTDVMGHGDDKLGHQLLKGCIYAISQLEKLPGTMLFYNGGARLTCEGSESLEDLRGMAEKGVEILTCGTCLNYYGLAEKLAVGSVTNMYTIVEKLAAADKVVKP